MGLDSPDSITYRHSLAVNRIPGISGMFWIIVDVHVGLHTFPQFLL